MVHLTTILGPEAYREKVAQNLNRLLDRVNAPPRGQGRAQWLADRCQCSRPNANKWLLGSALPEPYRYQVICAAVSATIGELLGEDLDMIEGVASGEIGIRLIPENTTEGLMFRVVASPLTRSQLHWPEELFAYIDDGDTMEPYCNAGEPVFCSPVHEFTGAGVYAIYINGRLTLRRVEMTIDGTYSIRPENSLYSTEEVPASKVVFEVWAVPEKVTIAGRAVGRLILNR